MALVPGVLFRHSSVLLAFASIAAGQNGASYYVRGNQSDDVRDNGQGFAVAFELSQSGGATSPTTDAKLQTSLDGTVWEDVVVATQLTSSVTTLEIVQVAVPIYRLIRAITTVGGGTPPSHAGNLYLISNGNFSLTAV
jgi:hypothetical protein